MDSSPQTWRYRPIQVLAAVAVGVVLAGVTYGGWRLGRSLWSANSIPAAQEGANEAPADTDQSTPAVAPVVLYEVDRTGQSKRYDGSVSWRTDPTSRDPKVVINADARIPDKQMTVAMLLRRNTDSTFPASHVIELKFEFLADAPYGEIASVPGLAMKPNDQASGARLTVQGAKISSGSFLLALSDVEADMSVNLKLLKEQSWLMIPLVYGNGNRAMLNLNKGAAGERAFNDAFAAWGE